MFRLIAANTFFQLLAKFISALLTFVTTLLIIRLGGTALFGDFTKTLSLVAIGFTAIDFGLNAEAVRSMRGDRPSRRQIISDVLLARILLSTLVIIGVNLLGHLLPGGYTPAIKSVLWVGSLAIIFQGIYTSLNAWFQREYQYWRSSLATIIGTGFGTLFTYLFLVVAPGLFGLLLASSLGYLVMSLASLKLAGPLIWNFSFTRSFLLIKRALTLGLILLANVIASKIDAVILGVFRSSTEVGQYGFAYRIFDLILVLPVFAMNSLYPLLIDSEGDSKSKLVSGSTKILFIFGLLSAFLTYFIAPYVLWIRADMELSVVVLRTLSFFLPFFYLTAPLMWAAVEAGREKSLLSIYVFAALINALLNLIYIPIYGALASALITGVTEIIIYLSLLRLRHQYHSKNM